MALDHLSALVRAVSRLRPPGALNPLLVDALATLLLPRADARLQDRPLPADEPVHTPRPVSAPTVASPQPPIATGAAQPTNSAPGSTARPKPRGVTQDPQKLVALESALVQLAERADLAAPQRRPAGRAVSLAQAPGEAPGATAPLESLFPATRVRAILRDMATCSTPSGQPDIAAAVQLIARAQPISTLPQHIKTTLGHNIVLLFDIGPAMLPFARDKQQLAATALRLLGRDRVRVNDFLVDPILGVRAQRQVRWQPLHWPGRGSTLVLISDLGIGDGHQAMGQRSETGWAFLDECGRRGLRSVALIPYAPERWPALAAHFDAALSWDLDTGVQALRRSMRQHR